MRYICPDCGSEFSEDEGLFIFHEPHLELDGCPLERMVALRCPFCGTEEEDLEEVREEDADL